MRIFIILLLFMLPQAGFSQENELSEYNKAEILLQLNKIDSAFVKFNTLEKTLDKKDTLYEYVLWYRTMTATELEKEHRSKENFERSLEYGLNALDGINKGKEIFDTDFAKREYLMVKNITVSQFGLNNFKEGNFWKQKMYKAKKDSILPEGIDTYFNFDFLKIDNKNVWGYEWFEELPKNRYSSSFSKVVYYVYSTNDDGSDKDQLYRLHVLMFHGDGKKFNYVLDKRLETATEEVSGTLYGYTYQEEIDYKKLKSDIIEVVNGNLNPDTKRTKTTEKDGKTNVNIDLKNG